MILFPASTKAVISMHTVRGLQEPTGDDSNPVSWALPTAEQWKVARMQSLKKKNNNAIKNSLIASGQLNL